MTQRFPDEGKGAGLLRVFIGYDPKEAVAYHVLCHSILSRCSVPISITPLVRSSLGMYTRPRGPTESTEFSITRFLVPYLCDYEGWALFLDCDMLVQCDLADLLMEMLCQRSKAVLVCQHDYSPKMGWKFEGHVQTAYPRKNWSSFMVFNASKCKALTPEYVNEATGLDLHRFNWISDDLIGSLSLDWNHLVEEYPPNGDARVLHYTRGGPWFSEFRHCDHADAWRQERDQAFGQPIITMAAR